MAVSKKDFVAVANILRNNNVDAETVKDFCEYFRSENPRFDANKFREYVRRE